MNLVDKLVLINKGMTGDLQRIETEDWEADCRSQTRVVIGGNREYPHYWIPSWKVSVAGISRTEAMRLQNLIGEEIRVLKDGSRTSFQNCDRLPQSRSIELYNDVTTIYSIPYRLILAVRNHEEKSWRVFCSPDLNYEMIGISSFHYTERKEAVRPYWCQPGNLSIARNGGTIFVDLVGFESPNYTENKPTIIRAKFEDTRQELKRTKSFKF